MTNITYIVNAAPPYQRQGAIIHSVATVKEHKVHYGVQSATFIRTVFPGQASGTYKLQHQLPTWRGAQITAALGTVGSSRRAAGSPPIPYPPGNASAYYSSAPQRIIANPHYNKWS